MARALRSDRVPLRAERGGGRGSRLGQLHVLLGEPRPADANLQAYILIIVRNKCLDWLRAQSLHAKIEQEVYELRRRVLAADIRSLQAFNPEEIFSAEVAAIVRQSLDRLPELTREVFVARRFEELSYKEIAEKYGITVRRVEFELEKAVKQLRVALKDYLPVLLMLLSDNILRS